MYSVLSRIEELFPKYITEDSTIDLLCSLSINQIYETCAQNPPLSLDGFRQSAFDALGLENSESLVEKEPRISAEELPLERLTEALGKLAEDYEISDKEWESGRAIGKVLLEIAKRTPDTASSIIARNIASSPSTIPVPYEALDHLAETIGRKVLRNELGAVIDVSDHPALFDYLDLLAIKNGPDKEELDEILARLDDGRTHLCLEDLEIVEPKHPGYILKYASWLSEHIHNDGGWRFFGNCGDEKRVSALDSYFESNPSPAVNLYFLALEGYPTFDYNLAFLRCLLRLDSSMIDRFLEYVANLDYRQRHDLLRRISSFWTVQDDHAWNLLKAMIDEALSEPLGRLEIAVLFPVHDANALSSDIFWERLEYTIRERIADANSLDRISWALSDCNDETRIRAITLILTLDKDGISINHLDLRRSSMSGSPEKGFIPAKLKEIEAIDSIAAQLPAGVAYLKHREWLSKVKSSIERDIEDEKWRLFHGRQ